MSIHPPAVPLWIEKRNYLESKIGQNLFLLEMGKKRRSFVHNSNYPCPLKDQDREPF